jgi:hypothetical protein
LTLGRVTKDFGTALQNEINSNPITQRQLQKAGSASDLNCIFSMRQNSRAIQIYANATYFRGWSENQFRYFNGK